MPPGRLHTQPKAADCSLPSPAQPARAPCRDPHMPGFFSGHRICHHSETACCAGFWARHRNDFTLGQVAQRIGAVEFVQDDDVMSLTAGGDHGEAAGKRTRRVPTRK